MPLAPKPLSRFSATGDLRIRVQRVENLFRTLPTNLYRELALILGRRLLITETTRIDRIFSFKWLRRVRVNRFFLRLTADRQRH